MKKEKKSAPAREIAPKLGFASSAPAREIAPELGFTSTSWCDYLVTRPSVNQDVYSYSSWYSSYDDIEDDLNEKAAKKKNSKIKSRAFKPKRKLVSKKEY